MNRQHELRRLKEAVAKHQTVRSLNPEQLKALMSLQTVGVESASIIPRIVRPSHLGLTSLLSAVAGVLLALWLGIMPSTPSSDRVLARIADEVAMNHLKLRPMEVRSSDLATLRRYFTELDFRPVQIALLNGDEGQLLGGRYCSIQGKTAAQFRVKNIDGSLRTVYEVRYDPRVHGTIPDIGKGESPMYLIARGVLVKIWLAGGVLFAVTGE